MAGKAVEQVQRTWPPRPKTRLMGYRLQGITEGNMKSGNSGKADHPSWFISSIDRQSRMMWGIKGEITQDPRKKLTTPRDELRLLRSELKSLRNLVREQTSITRGEGG